MLTVAIYYRLSCSGAKAPSAVYHFSLVVCPCLDLFLYCSLWPSQENNVHASFLVAFFFICLLYYRVGIPHGIHNLSANEHLWSLLLLLICAPCGRLCLFWFPCNVLRASLPKTSSCVENTSFNSCTKPSCLVSASVAQ